ncbi:hypothetical protein EMIT0P218_100176 [Pseudomonas sp. IT-P218]
MELQPGLIKTSYLAFGLTPLRGVGSYKNKEGRYEYSCMGLRSDPVRARSGWRRFVSRDSLGGGRSDGFVGTRGVR